MYYVYIIQWEPILNCVFDVVTIVVNCVFDVVTSTKQIVVLSNHQLSEMYSLQNCIGMFNGLFKVGFPRNDHILCAKFA